MRRSTLPLAALFVWLTIPMLHACDPPSDVTEPVADALSSPALALTVTDGDGFTRIDGETAGALFAAYRPDDWNGDLVLLMHGHVDPAAPVALFDPIEYWIPPVIDGLIDRGFGVALSSYRVNGWAVKEGAEDTRNAQAAFTAHFGNPADTYLYGWSMGATVGQMVLETSPARYAGFLPVCGNLAGSRAWGQYHLNARVLFDYYFPGALPWSVWHDQKSLFGDLLPALQQAFAADPAGFVTKWQKLASIDQLRLPPGGGTPQELVLSTLGSLLVMGGGNADLAEKTHGIPIDNSGTVYTSDLLSDTELEALNDGVARFEADPQAERIHERYYTPNGRLRGTPVLALAMDGDAVAPPRFALAPYEELVTANGNANLFVGRVVHGFGHCEYGGDLVPDSFIGEQLAAFDELVAWARGGAKPAS